MRLCPILLLEQFRVAVVGAGPAGLYCSQALLNCRPDIAVDVFDKNPVPYGLVRYGVAPDHQEVKNCTIGLERMVNASASRFRFYGNVRVDNDVRLVELKKLYTIVVLAYGAQQARPLLRRHNYQHVNNLFSAKQFVGWYNGDPYWQSLQPNLRAGKTAVIVGHGNVALDVARMLLKQPEELSKTDITAQALQALKSSEIRRVILIGRRGPLQVAFTTKELREMTRLCGVTPIVHRKDVEHAAMTLNMLPRARQRLTSLLLNIAEQPRPTLSDNDAAWELRFLLSLKSIELNEDGNFLRRLIFTQNNLSNSTTVPSTEDVSIDCDMLIYSYGYQSVNIEADNSLPFDHDKGVVKADGRGHVKDMRNVYACGWCRHGANGVLAQTQRDAKAIATFISSDIDEGKYAPMSSEPPIESLLRERNVQWLTWNNWKLLDNIEKRRGSEMGKCREKIVSIAEMLRLALQ